MNKLFLVFNHDLTSDQITETKQRLNIFEIVSLPEDLKEFWGNIPPDVELTPEMFEPIKNFLIQNKGPNQNFCLIQGDFGATCYMVSWCIKNQFVPIYATTRRISQELKNPDGTVSLVKVFKHVRFRRYMVEDT